MTTRKTVVNVLVTLVACATLVLTALAQRPIADLKSADEAVGMLGFSNRVDPSAQRGEQLQALEGSTYQVDTYLASDSAARLPDVSIHLERAWRAQRAIIEIILMQQVGDLALSAPIHELEQIAEDHPELTAWMHVAPDGTHATDPDALVLGLHQVSSAETSLAADALAAARANR